MVSVGRFEGKEEIVVGSFRRTDGHDHSRMGMPSDDRQSSSLGVALFLVASKERCSNIRRPSYHPYLCNVVAIVPDGHGSSCLIVVDRVFCFRKTLPIC